jgi:lysyl-tRNA synthetase class I
MDDFELRLQEAAESYDNRWKLGSQQTFAFDTLFAMFDTALKLWLSKEKTKYIDRKISLLKDWYEEYNRPDHSRLALDNIERELHILAIAFISAASEPGNAS